MLYNLWLSEQFDKMLYIWFLIVGEFVEAGETVRDQVVCYKCGQCFRQWAPTDNPIEEHKRINMECFDVCMMWMQIIPSLFGRN